MPKYVHRFTGEVAEHFGYLPADPPSQWLQPGQQVTCFALVEHPRLELVQDANSKPAKSTPAPSPSTTTVKEA